MENKLYKLLGYMAFKSGYILRVIGILLIIGYIGYIVTNSANLLMPNYEHYKATVDAVLSVPMAAGELSLAIWLLIKGGKIPAGE